MSPDNKLRDVGWLIRLAQALLCIAATDGVARSAVPANASESTLKHETFDHDPNWDGFNNRVRAKCAKTVKQDFGYSSTHHAGVARGEIGGEVQRSSTPAYYAAKIEPKSLNDHLAASGSFAITAAQGSAGVFFGFFDSHQPGGSGRPIGSLGFDFDFEAGGGRLAARLITSSNKSCGTFLTPYLPGKFRPTIIKTDGTRYRWTLDYNPNATASSQGQFTVTLASDTHKSQDYGPLSEAMQREAAVRFPRTTKFVVDLPPGFRREGATFDRFGLANMMKAGGTSTIYFDDLRFNYEFQDFSYDPDWIGVGNRATFNDPEQVGVHNFGYSPNTNIADGTPGEVGGGLWRSGDFACYADRIGPLDLSKKLEARGNVHLVTAGPDSDMLLGWFNSESKMSKVGDERNFVGVHIGGPTRIGHYFNPYFANAKGSIGKVESGPILVPGKTYRWSLVYDPDANHGDGSIETTLGDASVTLALKPGQKNGGANLDRFGFFTTNTGGQMIKIYFDDLEYSSSAAGD